MATSACSLEYCLNHLGAGHWLANESWAWNASASCCKFGEYPQRAASALLRGRRLAFLGDSQARRWMWSLVDTVGGLRRRAGGSVPDSSRKFDAHAVSINDTVYDSARAYHAGQTVLLNADTGRWVMLDPLQLCGVPRTHWTVDRKLVRGALRCLMHACGRSPHCPAWQPRCTYPRQPPLRVAGKCA